MINVNERALSLVVGKCIIFLFSKEPINCVSVGHLLVCSCWLPPWTGLWVLRTYLLVRVRCGELRPSQSAQGGPAGGLFGEEPYSVFSLPASSLHLPKSWSLEIPTALRAPPGSWPSPGD